MFCSKRGSVWKYANLLWVEIKKTTANWMPSGLIPKTVVWIGSEAIGAVTAEALVPPVLTVADSTLETYIPLYRQIPLVAASGLLIYAAAKTSKRAMAVFAVSVPIVFYFMTLKDLEDKTSEIAGFFILQISQLFATIGGGFFGLAITNSPEVFSSYRENMVVHALAGRGFEGCVKQPNALFFIPRLIARIGFQTTLYNRKPFWAAFKLGVRNKHKKLGFIAPTLTKVILKRFNEVNTIKLARDISDSILPYFLANKVPFFSMGIEGALSKEIARLQSNTETLVFILTRSLIEYGNLISNPKIDSLAETILYLMKENSRPELIQNAIDILSEEITALVIENTPTSHIPVERLGDHFLWNEQNLIGLSNTISQALENLGIYLFGKSVYPPHHINFIKKMVALHAKPFIYFTILRGLGMDISGDPLEDFEDINLTSTLYKILFFSLAEPLLPDSLKTPLKKSSTALIRGAAKTVQTLQGVENQARFTAPLDLRQTYIPKGATEDGEPASQYVVVEQEPLSSESDYEVVTTA